MRLLAVVVLAGCSGGIAASDYARELRDAQCELRVRCGLFPDTASCTPYFPISDDGTLLAAISAGTSSYDADKAQECVNNFRNTPCDETSREARQLPAACTEAVTGTGAIAARCFSNSECSSGACQIATCGTTCCAGSCVASTPPGKRGEPCASRVCDAGLTCDNTKTCVELFAAGMPCTLGTECAYGLGCAGTPGTCKALPKLGEPCPDGACAELGAFCDAAGTCSPVGLSGASCTDDTECSPYFACTAPTCAPNPAVGEPCSGPCRDGSWCNTTTGLCAAPQPDGASCVVGSQCTSGFCDNHGGPGACAAFPVCN
jgi:hypothetical protein